MDAVPHLDRLARHLARHGGGPAFLLVRESSERDMFAELLRQEWAAQERYGALVGEALAAHGRWQSAHRGLA
jgi:hypothetical protein